MVVRRDDDYLVPTLSASLGEACSDEHSPTRVSTIAAVTAAARPLPLRMFHCLSVDVVDAGDVVRKGLQGPTAVEF